MDKRYNNQIEILVSLFTVFNDHLKVLLFKRDIEPFKGYWMLPSNLLMSSETVEECAYDTLDEMVGLKGVHLKQGSLFSKIDRLPNERIVGNSLIGMVDYETIKFKRENREFETAWFNVNELPKMVYDHADVVLENLKLLKKEIMNVNTLKYFFKNDFTLPELQNLLENTLETTYDRRNFRKKLINLDVLIDTGDKNELSLGRPAKLYRFKDIESDISII